MWLKTTLSLLIILRLKKIAYLFCCHKDFFAKSFLFPLETSLLALLYKFQLLQGFYILIF